MAVNELSGFLKYKDAAGNLNLLYPITVKDNVDGIDEIEAEVAETVKFTAQALDDNQKAQVRTNIGAGTSDVELSTELTKAGYAADAKAVGDNLATKLDTTALPNVINSALNQGTIDGITLSDRVTGLNYVLYVENGALTMAVQQ